MKQYPKQQIIDFVREWKAAPEGPESFMEVCSRYPEEFRETWNMILTSYPGGWEEFERDMIQELYINRTKLRQALR